MTSRLTTLITSLLLFLVGCTGTVPEVLPTLLVIGYRPSGETNSRVGLLDTATLDTAVPSEDRTPLIFRELPAQARDFDVVDRDGNRNELAALSRNNDGVGFVTFFNLDNIDIDDPEGFAELRQFSLALENLEIQPGLPVTPDALCPSEIQVSETGRYLSVLNRLADCGLGTDITLSIIDLDTDPPTLTRHLDIPSDAPGHYLDQADDRLYYFVSVAAGANLRARDVDNPQSESQFNIDIEVGSGNQLRDLAPVQSNLIALRASSFVAITDYRSSPSAADPIDTRSNSRRLIVDPFEFDNSVYILGDNRFTVHQNRTDEDEQSTTLQVTSGSYDPTPNQFIYLLGPQRIGRFDALTFTGSGSPSVQNFNVDELENPTFITWIRAVGEELPGPLSRR